jgi:hypothetical protein
MRWLPILAIALLICAAVLSPLVDLGLLVGVVVVLILKRFDDRNARSF